MTLRVAAESDQRVEEFLAYAEHDRAFADHTVRRYRTVLTRIPGVAYFTVEDVDRWWESDEMRAKAPSSRNNEMAVLRSFYRWMTRWDHRSDDPTRRLDGVKRTKTVPVKIGRTELAELLKTFDDTGQLDLRRAACLGAYAGLRVGEAAVLEWRDIDEETNRIKVHGKGAKERLVGMGAVLLDELLPRGPGRVILDSAGKPYTPDRLQRKMNRAIQQINPELSYHSLRKRWVSRAIEVTGNVHAVAAAAGWASIETANTYAVLSNTALDQIAAATAPEG